MSRERTLSMTVQKVEAELLDVTAPASGPQYVAGRIEVTAICGGESHSWFVLDDERYWIGDRVEVRIIESDPEPPRPTPPHSPVTADRRRPGDHSEPSRSTPL